MFRQITAQVILTPRRCQQKQRHPADDPKHPADVSSEHRAGVPDTTQVPAERVMPQTTPKHPADVSSEHRAGVFDTTQVSKKIITCYGHTKCYVYNQECNVKQQDNRISVYITHPPNPTHASIRRCGKTKRTLEPKKRHSNKRSIHKANASYICGKLKSLVLYIVHLCHT